MKTERLMKFISLVNTSVKQAEPYRKVLKQQKLESLIRDISELKDNVCDLVRLGNCLLDNGFNLGRKVTGSETCSLEAENSYNLGFILENGLVVGVGIKGSNSYGGDLVVNSRGEVIKGYNGTYDNSEVDKMVYFINELEGFMERVERFIIRLSDEDKF